MRKVDVIIIGASFSGLTAAKKLAKNGLETVILERRKHLDRGIHTTGILTKEASNIIKPNDDIVKKITKVRLYSPSMKYLDIKSPDYFFQSTNMPALYNFMAKAALDEGVETYLNSPFNKADIENNGDITLKDYNLKARYLVGADGAQSKVAKFFNLGQNTKFLLGVEAEFKPFSLPHDDMFYCFLDSKICKGYIGWIVPNNNHYQIGLAVNKPNTPRIYKFIDKISPYFDLDKSNIIARRGGLIPVNSHVNPISKGNICLIGDAAGLVSHLSAGGIHTALSYSDKLADELIKYLKYDTREDPAKIIYKTLPKFHLKKLLRFSLENLSNDFLFNLLLTNPAFKYIAQRIFFSENKY